jgi:hypothetical protein
MRLSKVRMSNGVGCQVGLPFPPVWKKRTSQSIHITASAYLLRSAPPPHGTLFRKSAPDTSADALNGRR